MSRQLHHIFMWNRSRFPQSSAHFIQALNYRNQRIAVKTLVAFFSVLTFEHLRRKAKLRLANSELVKYWIPHTHTRTTSHAYTYTHTHRGVINWSQMTAELTSRCVADSRPSRSNHHQQLLHPTKTDEIEILEAGGGGGGGIEEHHETKVSSSSIIIFISYLNAKYIVGSFTLCTACGARTLYPFRMEYLDPFCENNNFSFDSRRMGKHYVIYRPRANTERARNGWHPSNVELVYLFMTCTCCSWQ